MLKMAVWYPAIFMLFYEEKYGGYAIFLLGIRLYPFSTSQSCVNRPTFLSLTAYVSSVYNLYFFHWQTMFQYVHICSSGASH